MEFNVNLIYIINSSRRIVFLRGDLASREPLAIFFRLEIMSTHQVQIRHIVVGKQEVADLLKETIGSVEGETARTKMLMRLAEKYSTCKSREEGGNLGWMELDWEKLSPGSLSVPAAGYTVLENKELEKIIREKMASGEMEKGVLYGPVKTSQGYHLVLVAQEFATHRL